MACFKDSTGRSWPLRLDVAAARRVQDRLGVNLLAPEDGDPPLHARLVTDDMLLAQVIAVILEPQFAVMPEPTDPYTIFDGVSLAAAEDAWWQEYADFFQRRPDRAMLIRKGTERMATWIQEGVKLMNEQKDPALPVVDSLTPDAPDPGVDGNRSTP